MNIHCSRDIAIALWHSTPAIRKSRLRSSITVSFGTDVNPWLRGANGIRGYKAESIVGAGLVACLSIARVRFLDRCLGVAKSGRIAIRPYSLIGFSRKGFSRKTQGANGIRGYAGGAL